jgi:hypothetical protein
LRWVVTRVFETTGAKAEAEATKATVRILVNMMLRYLCGENYEGFKG